MQAVKASPAPTSKFGVDSFSGKICVRRGQHVSAFEIDFDRDIDIQRQWQNWKLLVSGKRPLPNSQKVSTARRRLAHSITCGDGRWEGRLMGDLQFLGDRVNERKSDWARMNVDQQEVNASNQIPDISAEVSVSSNHSILIARRNQLDRGDKMIALFYEKRWSRIKRRHGNFHIRFLSDDPIRDRWRISRGFL